MRPPGTGHSHRRDCVKIRGHIDEFRIAHVQRSDGWIATTWNNMSDPGAFAAAGAEEQEADERHRWPALVWWSA